MTESELKEQARFAEESVELFRAAIEWAEREGESMTMAVRENRFTGTDARRVLDLVDSLRSARKDAGRLDWLESSHAIVAGDVDHTGDYAWCCRPFGPSLRETIDAQMSNVPSSTQEEQ